MSDFVDKMYNLTTDMNNRLHWNDYFMSIALLVSSRSPCSRLHVGSVFVKDNRIICVGYNGFIEHTPHISRIRDNHEISTVHSEQNAVADAASRGVSIKHAAVYITHYPCINCCKILAASKINRIIYLKDYNNDPMVAEILHDCKITITKL
jgi:dCMP deaminase